MLAGSLDGRRQFVLCRPAHADLDTPGSGTTSHLALNYATRLAPKSPAVLGGVMDVDLGGSDSMVGSAAWVGRVAVLRPGDRAPLRPGFGGCPHFQRHDC